MKTTLCAVAVLYVALVAADAGARETPAVGFVKKPVASRDGDRVRIEFELNGMTDVAVYILDGDNRVVRHLAAGVLGEHAPDPFRKNMPPIPSARTRPHSPSSGTERTTRANPRPEGRSRPASRRASRRPTAARPSARRKAATTSPTWWVCRSIARAASTS
jgi:hypothetical protein